MEALAITDHDGFYGVVRFAEAAKAVGLPTVFGTEISLSPADGRVARSEADTLRQVDTGMVPDSHAPDPSGTHLLVLADGPSGYARLSRTLSNGHLAGEKGAPQFAFGDVADTVAGHGWVLTGCRKGAVPAALIADGPAAARRELLRLVDAFGRDRVLVELWDHGDPLDSARNDALVELAHRERVECVATNNVHYATPAQRRLATALAAVRARRSLDAIDPWLPAAAGAHLRSGAEQAKRFRRYPGVIERAAEIGRAAAFDLSLVAPKLPPFPCPAWADRDAVPAPGDRGGSPPPLRRTAGACRGPVAAGPGVDDDRPRAGVDRAARLRRVLPDRVGHRRVLPPRQHLLPGSGERRQLGGLLRPRRHRRRRGVAGVAVRALPVART